MEPLSPIGSRRGGGTATDGVRRMHSPAAVIPSDLLPFLLLTPHPVHGRDMLNIVHEFRIAARQDHGL